MKKSRLLLAATIGTLAAVAVCARFFAKDHSANRQPSTDGVMAIARSFPDGGGYSLNGTGCPIPIGYEGVRILAQSKKSTYCCGYTFAVMWKVALERHLFDGMPIDALWKLQRDWFASEPASAEEGSVYAMEHLKIGARIPPIDASPGDFLSFQRTTNVGHQAIFLSWLKRDGHIIGVRYRGSQSTTSGIGDSEEYFAGSGVFGASVQPAHFYVGRLLK